MAITTPAGIQITSTSGLMLPTMGKQPLQRALENLNYLWKFHRPPLVDVCLNPSTTRDYFVIPIMPSADGLDYTAVHRLMPTNTTKCNITIDYCTASTGGGTTWDNLRTIKAGSGFVPFDDGLLNRYTGGPLHPDSFKRCTFSHLAFLRDRRQNCLSM